LLNCGYNELTDLNLTNSTRLEGFICNDNYINKLEYTSFNPNKLVHLDISNNNLSKQDLSVFSKFVNLKVLGVGNDNDERVKKNIYNRFTGSLEPLQNLVNLKKLFISNTDVNSGLEYLPSSLDKDEIYCSTEERPESKVKEINEKQKGIIHETSNDFTSELKTE